MKRLLFGFALAVALPSALAQSFPYQQPPEAIRTVLDAKPLPARFIDPTATTLAVGEFGGAHPMGDEHLASQLPRRAEIGVS